MALHISSPSRQTTQQTKWLSQRDLYDLGDILAIQLHAWLGHRVYRLQRTDIAELILSYVDDLTEDDRNTVSWIVWHLFQEARDMRREQ